MNKTITPLDKLEMSLAPDSPVKVRSTLHDAFRVYHQVKWERDSSSKDGVLALTGPSPLSDKRANLFEVFIPGISVDDVEAIVDDEKDGKLGKAAAIYKFDALLEHRDFLKKLPDGSVMWLSKHKTPVWGVAPREMYTRGETGFLTRQQLDLLGIQMSQQQQQMYGEIFGDRHFFGGAEEGSKIAPLPETQGYCRGAVFAWGLVAIQCEKGVYIVNVFSADPKGWLPPILVNMAVSTQMDRWFKMREMMVQAAQERKEKESSKQQQQQQQSEDVDS